MNGCGDLKVTAVYVLSRPDADDAVPVDTAMRQLPLRREIF